MALRYCVTKTYPFQNLRPGEVRVRVHAVGINPPDWYLRDGYRALPPEWQPKVSFPIVLGTDISGVIDAVADSTRLTIAEIAYQLGFEHPQSFNKLFKRHTSLSPSAFGKSFD